MYKTYFESPIGLLEIICNDKEVLEIKPTKLFEENNLNNFCIHVKTELEKYFCGKLKSFQLPLKLSGTEFQNKVWKELLKIPFGELISYQELAKRIGNPKAVRAVANAVGKNKIIIIIPCHRIIGTDNTLTGFSAGLENKLKLLKLENHQLNIKKDLKKSKVKI